MSYAGGGGGLGIGVLIVWIFGFVGIAVPNEVAAVIGSLAVGAGVAVGAYGLKGCCNRLWNGRPAVLGGPAGE